MTFQNNNIFLICSQLMRVFPGGSDNKESACNAGDLGSIPWLEGMATHSSILAWRIPWTEEPGGTAVHGVAKSQTRLND